MMMLSWRISSIVVLLLMAAGALSFSTSSRAAKRPFLRMDMEEHDKFTSTVISNHNILTSSSNNKVLTIHSPLSKTNCPIEQAQARVGMPWNTSIDPSHQEGLLYMPFWEWQLQYMKTHLKKLTPRPVTNLNGAIDFSLQTNEKKKARISNLCFESEEYRKIRMTYYDAGHKTQVFNSLWYPRANLPVLGIDVLQFNGRKHLAVVDFQPLHESEEQHDVPFSHLIQPIQSQYPSLQGKMSKRFYDETQFFSQHMLFARFEDPRIVKEQLFPAFQQYVKTHVDMSSSTCTNRKSEIPWKRHAAYDAYSAQRDPATALFEKMFGKEWARDFVEEFLFSLSREHRDEEEES